jgi:hypothetical protein
LDGVQDAVIWAVTLVAFFAMQRKSQFPVSSRKTFNNVISILHMMA